MNKIRDIINSPSAEERYNYFIQQLISLETVWGLCGATGWLVLPDENEEHLPVWPNTQLTSTWAGDDYSDCSPTRITLHDWLEKWLPGMARDGQLVAVCPSSGGDSIIVAADELLADIHEASND